jgi:predicted KAP-like P-loop ATPase
VSLSVVSDVAVTSGGDRLDFDRYVVPLVEVLTNPATETPLTIGVFGEWGGGKTSLIRMLDERLRLDHPDEFVIVHFNAWQYRREEGMLVPLLHTLHDTLVLDPWQRFTESANKIMDVVARIVGDVLLKKLTLDVSSLDKAEALERKYAERRGQVVSVTRNLRKTLEEQAKAIYDKGQSLVIFVDDLDRCQPDEIIDVLELLKVFFDVEHTFIVLAVDREVIDRGIQLKYAQFEFAGGRSAAIGAEYLEKMVQLPVQLYTLREQRVHSFIEDLKPPAVVCEQLDLLRDLLLPNPRKIKRTVNLLALTIAIADATPGLDRLDRGLLTRLVVMQV